MKFEVLCVLTLILLSFNVYIFVSGNNELYQLYEKNEKYRVAELSIHEIKAVECIKNVMKMDEFNNLYEIDRIVFVKSLCATTLYENGIGRLYGMILRREL